MSAQFPVSSAEMEDLTPQLTWIIQLGIQNVELLLGRKLMAQRQNICLFLVCQYIIANLIIFNFTASRVQETKFPSISFPKDELNFLDLVLCDRKALITMTCDEFLFRPLHN